jgi:hypothetical protein
VGTESNSLSPNLGKAKFRRLTAKIHDLADLPVAGSTVREAQNRRLRRAFPIMFHGLPNIFQKESGYFFQYLQFKFLEGSGCAKSQILAR